MSAAVCAIRQLTDRQYPPQYCLDHGRENLMQIGSISGSNRSSLALAVVFGLIFVLVAWDLLSDYGEGVNRLHVLIESAVLLISGGAMLTLLVQLLQHRRRLNAMSTRLASTREEAARWRSEYREVVAGLAQAIEAQFREWQLSSAEAEIGLLLLKGLGLKEIAGLRGTSERTVRDQAQSAYRKAGLAGRAELAAFFLEDLLLSKDLRS